MSQPANFDLRAALKSALRARAIRVGLSLAEIAERVGVPPSRIYRLDVHDPPLGLVARVAHAVGLRPSELVAMAEADLEEWGDGQD